MNLYEFISIKMGEVGYKTLRDFLADARISNTSFYNIKKNKRPSLKVYLKLSKTLGVSLDELVQKNVGEV